MAQPSPEDVKGFTIAADPKALADAGTAVANAQTAQRAAATVMQRAYAGLGGDPNKSLSDYNTANTALETANQNYNKLVQDAASSTATNRLAWQKNQDDQLRQLYGQSQTLAATAAENQKNRESQENIERIKSGLTFHTGLAQKDAEAGQATLGKMDDQAMKASNMNVGLQQMMPLFQNLPPGGGSVAQLLAAHPDWAGPLNMAGVINDKTTDATRIINGLTQYMATEMKPTGLGAMREYEFEAFRAALPNMLQHPGGQQQAMASLLNLNDRIMSEADWMHGYYNRQIPDESAQTPGATRSAHDLNTTGAKGVWQLMNADPDKSGDPTKGGLGPVIPHYTGAQGDTAALQRYRASIPPGRPYRDWGYQKNPDGTPAIGADGKPQFGEFTNYKPWQGM
jgi:hypothetical protein